MKNLILVSLCLIFIPSLALAGEWMDDFENPGLTDASWEIKQGNWEIVDGWWQALSPAIGNGCFAVLPNVETHNGLRIEVTEKDLGGEWANGYVIFAYVSDAEIYYAGTRTGRATWSIEQSALAGGENNFGEVNDARVGRDMTMPRFSVVIEGDDVVIYDDKNDEMNRHSFASMPVGPVGLANEATNTHFDDFVVSGPEVSGNLAVAPAGKLTTTWAKIKRHL